uniref:Uncharacterized protein n=1 Tax=Arundo donax TaxID=35708 RepID=A0A0A9DIF0_ARUDO
MCTRSSPAFPCAHCSPAESPPQAATAAVASGEPRSIES